MKESEWREWESHLISIDVNSPGKQRESDRHFLSSNVDGECLWCSSSTKYSDHQYFCEDRCGYLFAIAIAEAGHRLIFTNANKLSVWWNHK